MNEINKVNFKPSLFIGDARLVPNDLINAIANQAHKRIKASIYPPAENSNKIKWCRDHTVRLPSATHLIGKRLNEEERAIATALISPSSSHHYKSIASRSFGEGVVGDKESVTTFLQEQKIPFKKSKCVFEGGNVIFFKDLNGLDQALIGFNLVIATFVSLEAQGYYAERKLQEIEAPSDQSIFAARNAVYGKINQEVTNLHNKGKHQEAEAYRKQHFKEKKGYHELLIEALSAEHREIFFKKACELEAKFNLAKAEIAREIGIENPIFLEQRELHIDMEFIPLNGTNIIFTHFDKDPDFAEHQKRIYNTLTDAGLKVVQVNGIAKKGSRKCNLMNALRINSKVLVIPYAHRDFEEMDRDFERVLQKHGVRVVRVKLPYDTISYQNGGLRCFTMWK